MNGDPRGHRRLVAVSAYVRNAAGELLLVRTHARPDTWEMPGGRVEAGESLDVAVRREVAEETGMAVEPVGVTGVYGNLDLDLLVVVFAARLVGGRLRPQLDEIHEAAFVAMEPDRLTRLVGRPHVLSRILDAAHNRHPAPYESWRMRPGAGGTARVGPGRPDVAALHAGTDR